MTQLLLLLPEGLRNLFLAVGIWTREHIHETVHVLYRVLVLNIGLLGLGLLLARLGFALDWFWLIGAGRFMTSLAGMLATGYWLYLYVRLWVLAQAATIADTALIEAVKQATRPLPGTESTVVLPEIFTQARANNALRAVMSGMAAVAAGSAYASLVPVFTNLSLFFALVTLVFAMAFVLWPKAEESPNPKPIARKWLMLPLLVMIICTISFFRPFDGRRNLQVSYAEGEAVLSATPHEVAAIERLAIERNTILGRLPNLSDADQSRLAEVNQQIRDIHNGRYTDRLYYWGWVWIKDMWQKPRSMTLPTLTDETALALILILPVIGLLFWLGTKSKSAAN